MLINCSFMVLFKSAIVIVIVIAIVIISNAYEVDAKTIINKELK